MALVVGIPVTTAGTSYTLIADTTFLSFEGDNVVSTGAAAIVVTGADCSLTIGGHIYSGPLQGISTFATSNIDITVLSTGVVGSNLSVGIFFDATGSTINNAGTIMGGATGLQFNVNADDTVMINSGLIIGNANGVRCNAGAGDLTFLNTGTIRALNLNSFLGAGGVDKITNKGLMIGDVALGANNDTYDGRSGRVAANSNGSEVLGEAGNDRLLGGKFVDRLDGGADDDKLTGGLAKDILTGGTGLDQFIFNSKTECGDTITDFSVADDTIVIKASAFGGLPKGTLSSAAFHANTTGLAHDASDRFIYETDTDKLWYDANGNAAGGRILVADLNNVAFTRADILLI